MSLDGRVTGSKSGYSAEPGYSLATEPGYSFFERIISPMKGAYNTLKGVAEHTKREVSATIDKLVSAYNARKGDATLLPFDCSTGKTYDGSLSEMLYNRFQDVWGSASGSVYLINTYSGWLGPYSTVRARKHTRPGYGRDGFTLIELLVVISTVALLTAILMPALYRVRKQARAVVCQSNLYQLNTSLVTREGIAEEVFRTPEENWEIWLRMGLLCPMAKNLRFQSAPMLWKGSKFSAWGMQSSISSYGLNFWLLSRETKITSKAPVFLDSTYQSAGLGEETDGPPEYDDQPWRFDSIGRANINCINRHDGYINSSFVDYSIRKVGLKELWTLKWHKDFDTTGPWTKAGGVLSSDWPKWMRGFEDY